MGSNNKTTIKCTIEMSLYSGLYEAKVNGISIGFFTFKFSAKRAIKNYIANNFSDKVIVWQKNAEIYDN